MKMRQWMFLCVLLAAPGAAVAQPAPAPTVVVTQADESKFPLIELAFEVRTPDGQFILDAKREDFRVTEYDAEVPLEVFEAPVSREQMPTTVVLVVDHSGSMQQDDRIGAMKRAVASFLDGLPEGSQVAVVAFSSRVQVACPFTDDFAQVRAAVDQLEPFGDTRFFDAVGTALGLLSDEQGRRAVLALTDGMDTSSRDSPEEVVRQARRLGLPVHTLGLGDERRIAVDLLRQLAEATRGQAYLAAQVDQLKSIYEELARRLRSSYRAVYRSARTIPDGTLRPIQVFYRDAKQAGDAAVFIPGMVVPAPVGPALFLALVGGLLLLHSAGRRTTRGAKP